LRNVQDDDNYRNKYLFDRHVFQKFIAVMFVNYATTDQTFYGINKRDYGVSGERDMEATPLYIAIGRELREIERRLRPERRQAPPHAAPERQAFVIPEQPGLFMPDGLDATEIGPGDAADGDHAGRLSFDQASTLLPNDLVNEEVIMGTLASLCSAASKLSGKGDPETQRFARVIIAEASKLVQELKRLGIVSHFAIDPGAAS
jgi:hypothetical protein